MPSPLDGLLVIKLST